MKMSKPGTPVRASHDNTPWSWGRHIPSTCSSPWACQWRWSWWRYAPPSNRSVKSKIGKEKDLWAERWQPVQISSKYSVNRLLISGHCLFCKTNLSFLSKSILFALLARWPSWGPGLPSTKLFPCDVWINGFGGPAGCRTMHYNCFVGICSGNPPRTLAGEYSTAGWKISKV